MADVYKMKIAGCARELPICPIDDKLDIAAFIMFGDVEITEKTAAELSPATNAAMIDQAKNRLLDKIKKLNLP